MTQLITKYLIIQEKGVFRACHLKHKKNNAFAPWCCKWQHLPMWSKNLLIEKYTH